jgi:16S rRNA (guanine527-N7)-methyltransferase
MLDAARIAQLLQPFVDGPLSAGLCAQLQTYLDLLLRWNASINLTSVRDPEQIVTRHFGESLFAARILRAAGAFAGDTPTLSDIGSGAGFPGIPIKLLVPEVHVTLIESQNKKATFLREVIRALNLTGIDVFPARAEDWTNTAQVITLRAVEKFEQTLPLAASLTSAKGWLCLLIGTSQAGFAVSSLAPSWRFVPMSTIPLATDRIVLVGNNTKQPLDLDE